MRSAVLRYCVIALLIMAAGLACAGGAYAAIDLKTVMYHYRHNHAAGETVTFTMSVTNKGDTNAGSAYMYVILTNRDTGASIDPAATSAAQAINIGNTVSFSSNWAAVAGKYTVQMRIYNSVGDTDNLQLTEYGDFPMRVGNPAETLSVFPPMFNMGTLPYGRYMYPQPLEIKHDFFLYNRLRHQRPWFLRVYTDNSTRYKGIRKSIYPGSPAGLVSTDGKYTIPLKVWCLNYPPEDQEMGWDTTMSGPPPVDDDTYWKGPILDSGRRYLNKAAWLRVVDYSEMTADKSSWRTLIGENIYDTQYVTDVNPSGDFTLASPFSAYLATETSPASVKGNYSGDIYVEIYSP